MFHGGLSLWKYYDNRTRFISLRRSHVVIYLFASWRFIDEKGPSAIGEAGERDDAEDATTCSVMIMVRSKVASFSVGC